MAGLAFLKDLTKENRKVKPSRKVRVTKANRAILRVLLMPQVKEDNLNHQSRLPVMHNNPLILIQMEMAHYSPLMMDMIGNLPQQTLIGQTSLVAGQAISLFTRI